MRAARAPAQVVALAAAAMGLVAAAPAIGRLGSLPALQILALAAAVAGAVALAPAARRALAAAPLLAVTLLGLAQPRAVDLSRLAAGEFVLFAPRELGAVVAAHESFTGGIELTAEARDRDGVLARTRVTDGHAYAVSRAALLPPRGATQRIDRAAEARALFRRHPHAYDTLVVAAEPPWSAAGATLLTRELYGAAAGALTDDGLLQQSMPLARLTSADFIALLAAARTAFSQVALYDVRDEGVLLACRAACPPLAVAPLLDPRGVDRLLAAAVRDQARSVAELAAGDDDAWFETRAPAATARARAVTLAGNRAWLRSFAR